MSIEIHHLPRGAGKTTKAMEWLAADPYRVLVTTSYRRRQQLLLLPYDVREHQIITSDEALLGNSLRGRRISAMGFDDLDIILKMLFRSEVDFITLTKEETVHDHHGS